jgi:hypothetical protein
MAKETGMEIKNDYRVLLTNLVSMYIVMGMARLKDIVSGLAEQTARKSTEWTRDLEEMNTLRASWQRYRELSKQVESKERAVKIGYALLFNAPTKVNLKGDAYSTPDREFERSAEHLALNTDDLDLGDFPLWRIIREIVRQTMEIRVFELEEHLKAFGLTASRPAIESALDTHPKEFRVTKRGREKFVSLK